MMCWTRKLYHSLLKLWLKELPRCPKKDLHGFHIIVVHYLVSIFILFGGTCSSYRSFWTLLWRLLSFHLPKEWLGENQKNRSWLEILIFKVRFLSFSSFKVFAILQLFWFNNLNFTCFQRNSGINKCLKILTINGKWRINQRSA